ncbi:SPT3 Dosage dependent suppressor of Ty-induced promoter mutations-like protein [Modicella reniformis]|uniref:SPT3 Dosage dependent suppressor of Ty-induced promoter mutations-like protein n=1 Tax=Modicella reniformis TaxID=1440133 RepID=A0A9P6SNK3_9FUNG|nr:SPT3 Dosage dependent suppressor of Ty-induced promoter mutations-like protein [Modicella reniformis]
MDQRGSFDLPSSQQHEGIQLADYLVDVPNSPTKLTPSRRLDAKTHVFKKELQEYVPTRNDDRIRIETIIYVELSIVKQDDGSLDKTYDYLCLPKHLFYNLPDKVMLPEIVASKRVLNVDVNLQCPSNDWRIEKEACVRCARRMSGKMQQNESRIMHMLPELYRAENGDALIHFRSGVANVQLKVNCYCGHKKEKEGFVILFESQDRSIAAHATCPLMFYHQNKNRIAARALAAAAKAQAKAQAKAEMLRQQQETRAKARSVVKSVSSSSLSSPSEFTASPEFCDLRGPSGVPLVAPSPTQTDSMSSLFPELLTPSSIPAPQAQQQTHQDSAALVGHMTPDSGSTRGGTLVTIHGSGFTVGEIMYICFGETFVPVIPQYSQMAETVPVFALQSVPTNIPAQCMFTYVDDNEKDLVKLALHRIMNISARMDGPLESVMNRVNELVMWSDMLGGADSLQSSSTLHESFSSLEAMIMESFKMLDTPVAKNTESLSISNNTGHTMLHLSVALKYKILAKDLILRGIDIHVKDKNGHTAKELARLFKDQSMMDVLDSVIVESDQSDMGVSNPHGKARALNMDNDMGDNRVPLSEVHQRMAAASRRFSSNQTKAWMDYKWNDGHVQDLNDSSSYSDDAIVNRRQRKVLHRDNPGAFDIPVQLEEQERAQEKGYEKDKEKEQEHEKKQEEDFSMNWNIVFERRNDLQAVDSMGVRVGASVLTDTISNISDQNHDRLLVVGQEGVYSVMDDVNAPLTAVSAGGQVVVARRGNNSGGSVDPAVRSDRHDVETESVLFLGGRPVMRSNVSKDDDKASHA